MKNIFCLSILLLLTYNTIAQRMELDPKRWKVVGEVGAMAADTLQNRLYVGGLFDSLYRYKTYGDVSSVLPNGPSVYTPSPNGKVYTTISDGKGGWYIGGDFTKLGDSVRHRIGHIDSSGQVTSMFKNGGFDKSVYQLYLNGNTLWVGGKFGVYGSTILEGKALIDTTTGDINKFPLDSAIVLRVPDDKKGYFIYRKSSYRVEYLDSTGNYKIKWRIPVTSEVSALLYSQGVLYIAHNENVVGMPNAQKVKAIQTRFSYNVVLWEVIVDGMVRTMERVNNRLIIGGQFSKVANINRSNVAGLDIRTGIPTGWLIEANGAVNSIVLKGAKVMIGGAFTSIISGPRNYFAVFDTATAVNYSNYPQPDAPVLGMKIIDNKVGVFGDFIYWGSSLVNKFTIITENSGAVVQRLSSITGKINTVDYADNKIYLGGTFSEINGQHISSFAVLRADSMILLPTRCVISGGITRVFTMYDKVYFYGVTNGASCIIGQNTALGIAALDIQTTALKPYTPRFSYQGGAEIYGITSNSNKIYFVGSFDYINNVPVNHAAIFDTLTLNASAMNLGFLPSDFGRKVMLLYNSNSIYVGGANYLKKYSIPGNTYVSNNVNGAVNALYFKSDTLFIGGNFSNIMGQPRSNLAAIKSQNTADSLLGLNLSVSGGKACVWTLNGRLDKLFIGGSFNSVLGQKRVNFAEYSISNQQITNKQLDSDDDIFTISNSDSKIYLGGAFQYMKILIKKNLFEYDLLTDEVTEWIPPVINDKVNSIIIRDSILYLAGAFTGLIGNGGIIRSYAAAINRTTKSVTAWNPEPNDQVFTQYVINNRIYLGGAFTYIGGIVRSKLASFDLGTGQITNLSSNFNGNVYKITSNDNMLYVAGEFSDIDNKSRTGVARYDLGTGSLDGNWRPDVYSNALQVYDLYIDSNYVYLAGGKMGNMSVLSGLLRINKVTGKEDKSVDLKGSQGVSYGFLAIRNYFFWGDGYRTSMTGLVGSMYLTNRSIMDATRVNFLYRQTTSSSNDKITVPAFYSSNRDVYIGGAFAFGQNQGLTSFAKYKFIDFTPNRDTLRYDENDGVQGLSVIANVAWRTEAQDGWINTNIQSGDGDEDIIVGVQSLTKDTLRYSYLSLTADGLTREVVIEQKAVGIINEYDTLVYNLVGGTMEYDIDLNGAWTAKENSSWITLDRTSGPAYGKLSIIVDTNRTVSTRVSYVEINSGKKGIFLVISQLPGKSELSLSVDTLFFASKASTQGFSVISNTNWTSSTSNNWAALDITSGNGSQNVQVIVQDNKDSLPRILKITFWASDIQKQLVVLQDSGALNNGIKSITEADIMKPTLYPNPANGICVLENLPVNERLQIQVMNGSGLMVLPSVEIKGKVAHEFSISTLEAGIYFVCIKSDAATKTLKLVKIE